MVTECDVVDLWGVDVDVETIFAEPEPERMGHPDHTGSNRLGTGISWDSAIVFFRSPWLSRLGMLQKINRVRLRLFGFIVTFNFIL